MAWTMTAGVIAMTIVGLRRPHLVILLAPLAAAALPWTAFVSGHPYRIRYIVPLVAFGAVPLGLLVGLLPRLPRTLAAASVLVLLLLTVRPLDAGAPMVLEAQWDRPNVEARRRVTKCLTREFAPGEKIMASMGSLAHYMQELSADGFALNDFLHEGNGDIWLQAIVAPRPYVEWMLVNEYSEGGDILAHLAAHAPRFLEGYSRACDGAGIVLYRRDDRNDEPTSNDADSTQNPQKTQNHGFIADAGQTRKAMNERPAPGNVVRSPLLRACASDAGQADRVERL
jgi:hypothetical protein